MPRSASRSRRLARSHTQSDGFHRRPRVFLPYLIETADGQWILTGLLDDFERAIRDAESRRPKEAKTAVKSLDQDLAAILEAHEEAIEGIKRKNGRRDVRRRRRGGFSEIPYDRVRLASAKSLANETGCSRGPGAQTGSRGISLQSQRGHASA